MSSNDPKRLSEEMAARLWQRAAELQSEAARRIEKTAHLEADPRSEAASTDGYALEHVRLAAEDAGIATEFVDAALAEVAAQSALGPPERSKLDDLAKRLLGHTPDFLEARRAMAAPAGDVYETMQAIFPSAPFNLALRDIQGDVLDGGVLVFDVPGLMPLKYTRFEYDMSHPGVKQLLVSIHPLDAESCEVVLRAPLQPGRKLAGGIYGGLIAAATGFGALAGGVGAGVTLSIALGLSTMGLVPVVAGLAVLGGGTLGGGARMGLRKLYRWAVGRGHEAMEGLLGTLNVSVISDWGGGRKSTPNEKTPVRRRLGAQSE